MTLKFIKSGLRSIFVKRLIGIFSFLFLFFGFVYLYNGTENYWLTILVMIGLIIFVAIIVGIISIFKWAMGY